MAQVVYSENALANLERAFDFLAEHDPQSAASAEAAIRGAIEMLGNHPFIGRRVDAELRELMISYDKTGHLALYRYLLTQNQIRTLAIRHQRELDYPV